MTELLEHAFERIRALPPDQQDEFARVLLRLAGEDEPVYQLTPEEEADFEQARAEIARGEYATDDDLKSIFAKHGL